MTADIADLASRLDGVVCKTGAWFDGFWDFFTSNRDRLERGPGWEIQGGGPPPWAIEFLGPCDDGSFEIHLFVECKDRRPGVCAPWPVSAIVLAPDAHAEVGPRDAFDRPHDGDLARQLAERGFDLRVGYWGVHCTHFGNVDVESPHQQLSAMPTVVRLALDLTLKLSLGISSS